MSGGVDVSVVVPTRDGAATLGAQLDALAAQRTSRRYEVLVADNGSSDGTADLVRAAIAAWSARDGDGRPELRLVDASRAPGANVARNCGVAETRAPLVLFCDCDDVVDGGWLEAMADGLSRAAAVGGRVDRVALNPGFVALWGEDPEDWGVSVDLGFLPRPIGASAGVRRAVWEEVEGFDEAYSAGGDETEFFWRVQLAGHDLLAVPEAVVHYRVREDIGAMTRQWYGWGRQSAQLYRDFRGRGLRLDARRSIRMLLWTAKEVVLAAAGHDTRRRLEARLHLAQRLGTLVGAVRYRVLWF